MIGSVGPYGFPESIHTRIAPWNGQQYPALPGSGNSWILHYLQRAATLTKIPPSKMGFYFEDFVTSLDWLATLSNAGTASLSSTLEGGTAVISSGATSGNANIKLGAVANSWTTSPQPAVIIPPGPTAKFYIAFRAAVVPGVIPLPTITAPQASAGTIQVAGATSLLRFGYTSLNTVDTRSLTNYSLRILGNGTNQMLISSRVLNTSAPTSVTEVHLFEIFQDGVIIGISVDGEPWVCGTSLAYNTTTTGMSLQLQADNNAASVVHKIECDWIFAAFQQATLP